MRGVRLHMHTLPVEQSCAKCGEINTYISPSKSYKCKSCGSLLDWRPSVVCNNCKTGNRYVRKYVSEYKCKNCGHKLEWSLDSSSYIPNYIPLKNRLIFIAIALSILATSVFAARDGSFVLPWICGARSQSCMAYVLFEGWMMIIPMSAALLSAIAFIALVVDHYDKGHRELIYRRIFQWSFYAAMGIYFVAIVFGEIVPGFIKE